jgi:hypothetical protein
VTNLYRVVPWLEAAEAGEPGHPMYVDVSRQGGGRADNPRHYQALYVSESPQGAVGEAFGDLASWSDAMFDAPWLDGGAKALATFAVEEALAVLDLDDAQVLLDLGARPTEVIGRDRERTRELALSVWLQRRWEGVRWWSWWRPAWRNQVLWAPLGQVAPWTLHVVRVEPLSTTHGAVQLAAEFLRRRIY